MLDKLGLIAGGDRGEESFGGSIDEHAIVRRWDGGGNADGGQNQGDLGMEKVREGEDLARGFVADNRDLAIGIRGIAGGFRAGSVGDRPD